ncbi:MAG: LptA/OstA family protein, partial [Parazoarcus communis]
MNYTLPSILLIAATLASPALAERADRDKPVDIEANRVTVDDRNKVHIFEGDVVLTQGTLM